MKEKVAEWLTVLQGFRKFIIALLVLNVCIIFRMKALLNGTEFVELAKSVTLGFFGTNSAESLFTIVKEHLQARREAGSILTPPKEAKEAKEDEEVELVPDNKDSK